VEEEISDAETTVKLRYNRRGYYRYSVNSDFFLILAESLFISVCGDTLRKEGLH